MSNNKVQFGLENAHYATFKIEGGNVIYDKPIPLRGSVELNLEPRGDMEPFYADNMIYYSAPNNQGYDGTLTIATIPEQFAIDCLGEEKDIETGTLTEVSNAKPQPFALLFEFDGDQKATRHVLYHCVANRPTMGSATRTDSVEVKTNELTFVASRRLTDNRVKTKTLGSTPDEVYNAWYSTVFDKAVLKNEGAES
ncbi:major tail protein [Shouchella lonarensis]|uniref:Phage major tail protein, phi13 family n=1 Tax=Shouchella lonarensis TaxID=1464122 RepID=A0A1G6III6_9BACI|nr:major tail protein [Shouchella lonarensis]SDC06230.1 phage major tail protein, phi13 family [Shouchella lonarensis]